MLLEVQFSSVAQSCPTLWDPMDCSMPGLPVHHQLLEFTQTQVHQVGDAIQPSHPLLSPSPPAPNPSQHQCLFQWVNSSHEVAKVLEFQLQHQSFQWTSRTDLQDWSQDLQYHSSKASILWCSAFFTVQLSHPFMTTGKTIALTRRTFVCTIMSLLFNMLSMLVLEVSTDIPKEIMHTSCLGGDLVAKSRPTLCDSTDCSLPGSCPWEFPARILDWVAISFTRRS